MSTADWADEPPEQPRERDPKEPPPSRRQRRAFIALGILAAAVVLTTIGAGVWTDRLWFDSLGQGSVWWTRVRTQLLLFVLGFLIIAVPVAASLIVPVRYRPDHAALTPGEQALAQYRAALAPYQRAIVISVPTVLGILGGIAAGGQWQRYLMWRNSTPFGTKDPHFNRDVSYYIFDLPWLGFVVGFLTVAAIASLLAAAFTHYVYGGLRPPTRGRSTRAAFVHLAIIGAVLVLLRGYGDILEAHALTTSEGAVLTGVNYTGAHAVIPAKYTLAVAAVLCAGLFAIAARTLSWRLPIIGVATLVVLSILAGSIYPALVETYKVAPSRASLEQPYLQRTIDATRAAHGVADVEATSYNATSTPARGQLSGDADTIPGIRLLDPAVVSPTYRQDEAKERFYTFPNDLDVDRYRINDEVVDTVVGARELDLSLVPADRRDWVNDHTVFTHGFGLVAARGNTIDRNGKPAWIDLSKEVGEYEPRIYFGERTNHYVIVGAAEGAAPREVDTPGGNEARYTYTGDGGVSLASPLRRAAFALSHRDIKLLLSDGVNENSRILEHRTPLERVNRVAPWLTLDSDPYPTIVDGRIVWVVDGFTTSSAYPYSTLFSLSGVRDGTFTPTNSPRDAVGRGERLNYMRNSVKATVDAYDGSVTLYRWDDQDPILKTWEKAFPGLIRPTSEISSELMSHLRYPEDLFRMQRTVLADYHVTDAADFRAGQDRWRVPADPTVEGEDKPAQPPYYLTMAMPDQEAPSWSLTSTYIPNGDRDVMAGFLAVDADAGDKAGEPAPGYGSLRMLAVPRSTSVYGPGQVQNNINASSARSADPDTGLSLTEFFNINRRGSSKVTLGNLLTLPVGEGFLHVEPIYLSTSAGQSSFPLMRAVVVTFGTRVAWARDLDTALNQLFDGESGAKADDTKAGGPPTEPAAPSESDTTELTDRGKALDEAIKEARDAYAEGQEALKSGNFAAYDEAQKKLKAAIDKAAENQPGGGSIDLAP
ncbi:UPF0182 family protein [Janibacter sp. GXQ6167]|uniref:UPF0182 family membrane protein n=1 Tax=Janibacter sp. GXQ6167 TaxID=3240791 RepID=UPI003526AC12